MTKYIGPRIKIIRRLNSLPGLTKKFTNRRRTPGQNGKVLIKKNTRTSLSDDYKERLIEKQKIIFNYGISEKQLISYYKQAKRFTGSTGKLLLQLLESRLDCLVYRLGFTFTIPAAKQLINHGHIFVNEKKVNIPSFSCSKNDLISIKKQIKSKELVKKILTVIKEKRKSILKRTNVFLIKNNKKIKKIMRYKKMLQKSPFKLLLPKHLYLNSNKMFGQFTGKIDSADCLINFKVLNVIEYYARYGK